jgi:hypothetical protein
MKRSVVAALAFTGLATPLVAPVAASPPLPGPQGVKCGYDATSNPDPGASADDMTAVVWAGPMTWDRAFTITCTIRVDNNTHTGTPAATPVTSGPASGSGTTYVNAIAPTQRHYVSSEASQDSLCTSVTSGSTTIYWAPGTNGPDEIPYTPDDVPGYWTADATRGCSVTTQWNGSLIRWIEQLDAEYVEPVLCSVLQRLHGVLDPTHSGPAPGAAVYVDHEGDVFLTDAPVGPGISEANWRNTLFWDCPDYVGYDLGTGAFVPGADGATTPVIDR